MKIVRCLIVFCCLLPVSTWADTEKAIDACRTVYEGATANITAFAQQIIQYERLHEAMCDGKNVKTNFNLSSGMDVILNNIPIGGFLNISAGKDKRTQFCSNFDKEIFFKR